MAENRRAEREAKQAPARCFFRRQAPALLSLRGRDRDRVDRPLITDADREADDVEYFSDELPPEEEELPITAATAPSAPAPTPAPIPLPPKTPTSPTSTPLPPSPPPELESLTPPDTPKFDVNTPASPPPQGRFMRSRGKVGDHLWERLKDNHGLKSLPEYTNFVEETVLLGKESDDVTEPRSVEEAD